MKRGYKVVFANNVVYNNVLYEAFREYLVDEKTFYALKEYAVKIEDVELQKETEQLTPEFRLETEKKRKKYNAK